MFPSRDLAIWPLFSKISSIQHKYVRTFLGRYAEEDLELEVRCETSRETWVGGGLLFVLHAARRWGRGGGRLTREGAAGGSGDVNGRVL